MPYFDSFDICEAHLLFATLWHSGQTSPIYAKFGQLHRIRYKPSPLFSEENLSENAREIYEDLVAKHFPGVALNN